MKMQLRIANSTEGIILASTILRKLWIFEQLKAVQLHCLLILKVKIKYVLYIHVILNTPTIIIISNKPFCMTKWASYPPLPLIKSWMSKHWVMLMCLFSLGSMLTVGGGGGVKVQNCKETELWKRSTDWTEETTSLQWNPPLKKFQQERKESDTVCIT